MKTKHTEGEWKYGKFNNFEYFDIDCNGQRICSVYSGIDAPEDEQQEAEANAKLIAAAPDLLKACNEVLSEWHSNAKNMDKKEPAHIKAIRIAIQKATE